MEIIKPDHLDYLMFKCQNIKRINDFEKIVFEILNTFTTPDKESKKMIKKSITAFKNWEPTIGDRLANVEKF